MIDIKCVVQVSLLRVAQGATTLSMTQSSIVTDLCKHTRVTWDENEELLKPREPI